MKIAVIILLSLVISGCVAIPTKQLSTTPEEWVEYKEEQMAWVNQDWDRIHELEGYIQGMLYLYAGYDSEDGKARITFSKIERIDYFHGYIYLRRGWERLNTFEKVIKYTPFGLWALESDGLIGASKEWVARPSIFNLVFINTINAAIFVWNPGVGVIVPSMGWQEEAYHVEQMMFHPDFVYRSTKYQEAIALWGTPVIGYVTYAILYPTVPREFDAKLRKWIFFGHVPSLDSDGSWKRYARTVAFVAYKQMGEGEELLPAYEEAAQWLAEHQVKSAGEIPDTGNPVLREAKRLVGIIHREPYEKKMVFAPLVPGVMEDEQELPLSTRIFFFWK